MGSDPGKGTANNFTAINCAVISEVMNSAASTTFGASLGELLILEPPVTLIDLIKNVQCLPDRRTYCIAPVYELPLIPYMLVKVIEQFFWNLDAYFRHILNVLWYDYSIIGTIPWPYRN